jgi:uncharacterized protein
VSVQLATGEDFASRIALEDGSVSAIETHVSTLLFRGALVFKVKKPVHFGFVDLSTPEQRARACRREVELNRRLAPDVYLGVAEVVGLGGDVVDHAVVMHRMPDDRRLSTLVSADAPVDPELRSIAKKMAALHSSAPTSPSISAVATRDAMLSLWAASLDEMRAGGTVFERAALEDVGRLAARYLAGRAPLFEQRIAAGRVVDGHGDLLADDIFCLADGPRILDCLEFDDALRYGDAVADVAFLAMDLERLKRPDLALTFLSSYREFSGDTYPESLAEHYVAYRALIRSKVATLRAAQGSLVAAKEAVALLGLARRHLELAQTSLVVVGGLPGTGKSTLAQGLADVYGWSVLRTDEIRKDRAGLAHGPGSQSGFRAGIYSPAATAATYEELLARARRALGLGESVVLDGSFGEARWRDAAARVAEETATTYHAFRCAAPSDVASRRLLGRAAAGVDPSDATPKVAAAMAAVTEPWPDAVEVDTADDRAVALAAARAALGS